MLLVRAVLMAHSRKMSLSLVCLQATSLEEAQISWHITRIYTPCNIMLHFVSFYNLLSIVIL